MNVKIVGAAMAAAVLAASVAGSYLIIEHNEGPGVAWWPPAAADRQEAILEELRRQNRVLTQGLLLQLSVARHAGIEGQELEALLGEAVRMLEAQTHVGPAGGDNAD